MKNASIICWAALLTLFPVPVSAFTIDHIEASVGAWQQSPGGYVSYKSNDRIDLQDVLSYDRETRFIGRLKLKLPFRLPNFYLAVSPMKFEEASITDDFYDFGDITIIPGIDFKSKLIMNQIDIGFYYDIPLHEKINFKWLNIELGLNAKIIDAEASVTQDTLIPGYNITESDEETVVVPMLYLAVCIQPIKTLSFESEFRGLSYSDNDMFSLIGRLKINIYDPLFIAGGYRYDVGKSDLFDLNFDVDFSGMFIETGVQF